VTLRSGSTTFGSLPAYEFDEVELARGVRTLEWQNNRRRFSDGSTKPDELTGASVSVTNTTGTVRITNVVGGVAYFSPYVRIQFPDTIAFEIARGTSTTCLGRAWGDHTFFGVSFGYFRLDPGTELRYYRGRCGAGAAPYRVWDFTTISTNTEIGSGLVYLNANTLP
jgi:hypothetical protein